MRRRTIAAAPTLATFRNLSWAHRSALEQRRFNPTA
jgi:hypothetical protein